MAKVTATEGGVTKVTLEVSAEELGMIVSAMGKQSYGYELYCTLSEAAESNNIKEYEGGN